MMYRRCKRCGKEENLESNGYCKRCDEVLYGKGSNVIGLPKQPDIWIGTSTGEAPKWHGFRYRCEDFEQPCLVEKCIAEQRQRGVANPVAMVVCGCPKCRPRFLI